VSRTRKRVVGKEKPPRYSYVPEDWGWEMPETVATPGSRGGKRGQGGETREHVARGEKIEFEEHPSSKRGLSRKKTREGEFPNGDGEEGGGGDVEESLDGNFVISRLKT